MKKLEISQMENLQGGISGDCAWAIAGLVAGFAGAFVTTTPVGAGIFAVGFVASSVGMKSCKK